MWENLKQKNLIIYSMFVKSSGWKLEIWQYDLDCSFESWNIKWIVVVTKYLNGLSVLCAAASIATRTFMRRTSEFKSDFFSKLLPAMYVDFVFHPYSYHWWSEGHQSFTRTSEYHWRKERVDKLVLPFLALWIQLEEFRRSKVWDSFSNADCFRRVVHWNPLSADLVSRWVCFCRCLNRYHGAEGLRLYSQETWQLVMGSTGREEVAKYVDVVLDYYIVQSTAQNHLVKEVLCQVLDAALQYAVGRSRVVASFRKKLFSTRFSTSTTIYVSRGVLI